jgi:alkylated DNA repair protein alkB family protein 1
LAFQAVSSYCQSPHTTNIQLQPPKESEILTDEPMWELWKREHYYPTHHGSNTSLRKDLHKERYLSFRKLSWSTIGYHYDWTARDYPKHQASAVPTNIHDLSQPFAKASLRHECDMTSPTNKESQPLSFTPSACIVNYYHGKSIMGPHRDDSEHAVTKPIVSFSMGRPAVFLLGGDTKNDVVVPILVRPGDVMIMGGASRLNYHCMARLLPAHVMTMRERPSCGNQQRHQVSEIVGMPIPAEDERAALVKYLTEHRININLRQVYED